MEDKRIALIPAEHLEEILEINEKLNKENEELRQSLEIKEKETIEADVYLISYSSYMSQVLAEEKIKVVKANMEISELRKFNSSLNKHVEDLLESDRELNIVVDGLTRELNLMKVALQIAMDEKESKVIGDIKECQCIELEKMQLANDKLTKESESLKNKVENLKNRLIRNQETTEYVEQQLLSIVCKVKLFLEKIVEEPFLLTTSMPMYSKVKEEVERLYNEYGIEDFTVEESKEVVEPEKPIFIVGNELIPGITITGVVQQNKRTIINVKESKYGMSKTINATSYHMCENCKGKYPECKGKEIAFGNCPNGMDNVIACDGYEPYIKGEKHEK